MIRSEQTNKLPKDTRRNVFQWLKYLNITKEDKFEGVCICGCNQKIIPKTYHFYGNRKRKIRYIRGHNTKGKKMIYSKEGLESKRKEGIKLNERNKKDPNHKKVMEKNWENTVRSWDKETHPLWLGGKSFEPYGIEFNNVLRKRIRERDNYICQECFEKQNGIRLCVHHINYNKDDNREYNIISLCLSCHVKTNFDRKHWERHFKYLILLKYINEVYNLNSMEVI